ncbi:MAG: SdrD B-like domain-containing protein [Chloroflexota bacterium]
MSYRSTKQFYKSMVRAMRTLGTALLVVALLGLIPPPLVTSVTTHNIPTGKSSSSLAEALTTALQESLVDTPVANAAPATTCVGGDDLGGLVWQDSNADGIRNAGTELGFDGTNNGPIIVTAYDQNGQVGTPVTVDTDGTYFFDDIFSGRSGDDAHIRLEFSGLPSSMVDSIHGSNSGTTVQHHSAATCAADLGVLDTSVSTSSCPTGILLNNGELVATCSADTDADYVMGLFDPSGLTFNSATQSPPEFHHADWTVGNLGNIYFTEFNSDGHIYAAASLFTRVHRGGSFVPQWRYGNLGGGYNDLNAAGTLYRMDPVTGDPLVWARLPQQSSTFRSNGTGIRTTGPGLGGVAYDTSCAQVAVANMEDGKVYLFDASHSGPFPLTETEAVDIFDPLTADSGVAGMPAFGERVFGLEYYNGRLYYTMHDLEPGGTTGFAFAGKINVRSVAINSCAFDDGSDREEINESFVPISSIGSNPIEALPVLADIDIDSAGRMALGTMSAYLGGYYGNGSNNAPDLYNHHAGVYVYENSGGTWARTKYTAVGQHSYFATINETATGGVAWNEYDGVPGGGIDDILWMAGADFQGEDSKFGIVGYETATLNNSQELETSTSYIQFLFDPNPSFDLKGNGGDVDIYACSSIPLEIGNYVWLDEDSDGIQDPCEPPIEGVTVTLYNMTGTVVATTMTDASGEYYFNNANVNQNGATGLEPQSNYTITIDINQTVTISGNAVGLNAYNPTTPNVDSGTTISDSVDSDGILNGTVVEISAMTGSAGENDHTFDFGFHPLEAVPSVAVEKIRNTPDPVLPGATVTFTIRITNTGVTTITTLPLTDTYDTTFLTYVGLRTTPESDSTANSGQILWSDLTQAAPNGFGQDLGPNGVFDVVVEFAARMDTTSLPNSWTVNTAQVFTHTVTDTVRIFAPTNVLLSNRDVTATSEGVTLSWSTVNETELIGFHVLYIDPQSGDYVQVTDDAEMIVAEHAGRSNGADYRYMGDTDMDMDTGYHYLLALVMADGTRMIMDMGVAEDAWIVYLPVLRK